MIAIAVIWVSTALVISRTVADLVVVRDALDSLGRDEDGEVIARQVARRLVPMAREIWLWMSSTSFRSAS